MEKFYIGFGGGCGSFKAGRLPDCPETEAGGSGGSADGIAGCVPAGVGGQAV